MELDSLCINTVRFLAVDAVQKTNSGHPGVWLVGQDAVNTVPVETLDGCGDHGEAEASLEQDVEESNLMLQ